MKTYEFDVVLKDVSEVTDEQADRLFAGVATTVRRPAAMA